MSTVKPLKEAPPRLRALCDTKRAIYIDGGRHRIVDGVFAIQRKGDVVAPEVLVAGDASVDVSGHVEVKATERSRVRLLHSKNRPAWTVGVQAMDEAHVEIDGGEVHAHQNSHIIARGCALVFADAGEPTIEAYGEAIVLVCVTANPTVRLHDNAQVIRRTPEERALAA